MGERMTRSVVVHRPINEVYNLWANFDNFPNFMSHIKEVRKTGNNLSHWVMEGPMGKDVEWDAKTTAMEANRRIAWNSTGGDVDTNGEVTFRDISNNQTEVTVMMAYAAKGTIADMVAKYFTNTGDWMEEDLRNFKRYAEQMSARTGATGRSSFASDEEQITGTRGTSMRERTGAGAMGSTPGGPMNTPVGGTIGGTTGGREAGPSSTTGGFGGTSSGSTPGTMGSTPGGTGINKPGETRGTSGTGGTRGSSSPMGGTGTDKTSGGSRSGSQGGPTNDRSISGDREHSDMLDRDLDKNRDMDEGFDRDRNRDIDPDRERGNL